MSTLHGQVALVTGSSRGIGAAVAAELAHQGATVAVHGRDQAAVNEVAVMINGRGDQAIAVTGDLREFSQVEEIRRQVEAGAGPVDILVANAGGSLTPPVPLEEIPEDGWRASVDGNLLTTFLTLKSFLPGMKERRRGCVITIGSAAGRRADPRSPLPPRQGGGARCSPSGRRRRPVPSVFGSTASHRKRSSLSATASGSRPGSRRRWPTGTR